MVRTKDGGGIKSHVIISEVQKRPCLYDTNHPQYGDRGEKARSWEDVCQCIVPGWTLLSLADKLVAGKDIQKRWRSIRDSYTKAYRQGKCVQPDRCQSNSKRLSYHRQMTFLLRALQNKRPRYSLERHDSEVSNSPQPSEDILLIPTPQPELQPQLAKPIEIPRIEPEVQNLPEKNPSLEIKIDANSLMPSDYFDDDKLFMTSLLPLFKKMDDDTRLMCRIEVLKIFRYALQGKKEFFDIERDIKPPTKDSNSTLSMTTRSADGSRPIRKRKTRSPSPLQTLPKKRGPGRPRKIRRPSTDIAESKESEECHVENSPSLLQLETKLSELDEKLNTHKSVTELETPLFMKMYNLSRAIQPQVHVSIKTEPIDCESNLI